VTASISARVEPLPLRIAPDADLRRAIEDAVKAQSAPAAYVVAGIGSLRRAMIRLAAASQATAIEGPLEVVSLAGSVAPVGAHLHIGVSDAGGTTKGGHLAYGSIVRTTAEVMLLLLPEWSFDRQHDPATGYPELVVRRR